MSESKLPGEILTGAPRIAEYLGLREGQVRHLIEARRIPAFKLGKSVAARRTTHGSMAF